MIEKANISTKMPQRLEGVGHRLGQIITSETEEKGRFTWLERKTEIGRKTWHTWWIRSSMPSGNMIEAAGRLWPQYAFWLCTGMTDEQYGHTMPNLAMCKNFPEYKNINTRDKFQEYFYFCMHMQNKLYGDSQNFGYEKETMGEAYKELKRRQILRNQQMQSLNELETNGAFEKANMEITNEEAQKLDKIYEKKQRK
jgi:hypothetical protein